VKWEGECSTHGNDEMCRPEGKTPLGKLRRRREDHVKLDLKEMERGLDSSDSGYNPVVRSREHRTEPCVP